MSGFDASRDRAVISAIAQVASGYIHEINNKLGPILLNAETLALSSQDASDAAKDIARNVQDLLDMMRDIEAILPRNLESGMSVGEMVHLAERLGRGALRRRRLKMVLPEFDASRLVETERLATFIAMLLVPLVFHGPKEGGPGRHDGGLPRSTGQQHMEDRCRSSGLSGRGNPEIAVGHLHRKSMDADVGTGSAVHRRREEWLTWASVVAFFSSTTIQRICEPWNGFWKELESLR